MDINASVTLSYAARRFFSQFNNSYKSLISSFESKSRRRMRCRGIADICSPFYDQILTLLRIGHQTQVDRYNYRQLGDRQTLVWRPSAE